MEFHDGAKVEGMWEKNKLFGRAKMIYPNGDVYDGNWINNQKDGEGIYTMCNGDSVYKGFFKADLMHGKGILKYENGDEYEGDFKYNKKDGEGVFKYKQSSNNLNLNKRGHI